MMNTHWLLSRPRIGVTIRQVAHSAVNIRDIRCNGMFGGKIVLLATKDGMECQMKGHLPSSRQLHRNASCGKALHHVAVHAHQSPLRGLVGKNNGSHCVVPHMPTFSLVELETDIKGVVIQYPLVHNLAGPIGLVLAQATKIGQAQMYALLTLKVKAWPLRLLERLFHLCRCILKVMHKLVGALIVDTLIVGLAFGLVQSGKVPNQRHSVHWLIF
jgi:hypothetical protein